jgi:hypothetical protein
LRLKGRRLNDWPWPRRRACTHSRRNRRYRHADCGPMSACPLKSRPDINVRPGPRQGTTQVPEPRRSGESMIRRRHGERPRPPRPPPSPSPPWRPQIRRAIGVPEGRI